MLSGQKYVFKNFPTSFSLIFKWFIIFTKDSFSPTCLEINSESLTNSNVNSGKAKGLAGLATQLGNGTVCEKRPLTPNQTDELFEKFKATNTNQAKPDGAKETFKKPNSTSTGPTQKPKNSPVPLNPLPKKNAPFNLFKGISAKTNVSGFKDKKSLSSGSGLNKLEMSRSKIS